MDLTENSRIVLEKRYLRKNSDGEIIETPEKMFERVASAIAEPENLYGDTGDFSYWQGRFYEIMHTLEFVPNSPTIMNAGTGAGTLSACFVMGLDDSMEDIMTTAKETAMVQKYGGGTGFALSKIRPKGNPISTTHGQACGPVSVLRHLSSVSTLVTQGGKRDGANMAVMDVHHPDILEFIECKQEEGQIHNFNISVGVSDEFMNAVKNGTSYELRDPESGEVVDKIEASLVFDKVIEGAWRNGEPGVIFLDKVNADNPTLNIGKMTATNPCGEQPLLPYESCNLGSINLTKFVIEDSDVKSLDWDRLKEVVHVSTRFLDNVIDANVYSVDKIENMTKSTRKIGLGVMGFADMLVQLNVPYDSEEGLSLGRKLMKFIRSESDEMSKTLASERGVFPAFEGSKYDSTDGFEVRNACRLTVAPTGTISMIAGCSSGIEPLFALCYHKHNILGGESLLYVDKGFEKVAKEGGFYSQELLNYLADGGSLQERDDVPDWAKRLFVTSSDISPEMHVRMQAVFQESVDSAISKTINFPNSASDDDVRSAYLLAWELSCKGITVYRAGSRDAEVLTAGKEKDSSEENNVESTDNTNLKSEMLTERQRPKVLSGVTERVRTAHGNLFVTINYNEEGKPFEVFASLGKAGSTESAQLEAITRLTTMSLRAGVEPSQIIQHLQGITDEPIWDKGSLVRSTPDAVAQVLSRHLLKNNSIDVNTSSDVEQLGLFVGDSTEEVIKESESSEEVLVKKLACPDCSIGVLVHQEGCLRCADCGYNKCE
ncbi:MAG: ribonucleoside-diphosphate reductase, adenosylcobalamin-dependent [Chloroflexi bacterium]|nr:ribonucleoside-diphosphate reductase, adenosylcobalamin-dependent [Chloroflexota bacterium]